MDHELEIAKFLSNHCELLKNYQQPVNEGLHTFKNNEIDSENKQDSSSMLDEHRDDESNKALNVLLLPSQTSKNENQRPSKLPRISTSSFSLNSKRHDNQDSQKSPLPLICAFILPSSVQQLLSVPQFGVSVQLRQARKKEWLNINNVPEVYSKPFKYKMRVYAPLKLFSQRNELKDVSSNALKFTLLNIRPDDTDMEVQDGMDITFNAIFRDGNTVSWKQDIGDENVCESTDTVVIEYWLQILTNSHSFVKHKNFKFLIHLNSETLIFSSNTFQIFARKNRVKKKREEDLLENGGDLRHKLKSPASASSSPTSSSSANKDDADF